MSVDEILTQNEELFTNPVRNWSVEELSIAYALVNAHTGQNLRDTGCGSCRRGTIGRAIKIYNDWKKTQSS